MLDGLNTQSLRMATGFSGGLGDSREELCGALSGGVMVIGALYGRASLDEEDEPANRMARQYRAHFLDAFGHTRCGYLRDEVVNAAGPPNSCADLVEKAAAILLELLSEAG